MKREFEFSFTEPAQKQRLNSSLVHSILALLRRTAGNVCSWQDIADGLWDSNRAAGLSPVNIRNLILYARSQNLISTKEQIWGVWGVGYVCVEAEVIPVTLNQIGISIYQSANRCQETGLLSIDGFSLLSRNDIVSAIDPEPSRVIRVFDALETVCRGGDSPYFKPAIVGMGRTLVAHLANNPSGMTMKELVLKGPGGRASFHHDSGLIRTKFAEIRGKLEPFGLGIKNENLPHWDQGQNGGDSRYRLHNL